MTEFLTGFCMIGTLTFARHLLSTGFKWAGIAVVVFATCYYAAHVAVWLASGLPGVTP